MKQKLALCCALIHRPSILFLDEPTTGVDAVSRKEFWEMLKGLRKEGITILVSTPYMDEAGLCDKVALIQNGKFLSIDTPGGIVNSFSKPLVAVKSTRMLHLLNELEKQDFVDNVYPFGEYHHVVMKDKLSETLASTVY
jgi:ABC-type multidrug transport system ATPase subunit